MTAHLEQERLRVSLDVTAVPSEPAGAGRYVMELTKALAGRADVAPVLVCRQRDATRWSDLVAGVEVVARAPEPRPLRLVWEQARLPGELTALKPDVHHSPHYTMPERYSGPVVVTVHDLTFFDHPEQHERAKAALFRRAVRVAAARAAALVCVSRATAARLEALVPVKAPVHVIAHGVDHGSFRPLDAGDDAEAAADADAEARRRLGVERPYLAFVGTLEPRKDVPTLVAAFDRLAPSHPDLRLVLAGSDGWGTEAVARAIAAANHGHRVVRVGYLQGGDVPALVRGAAAVAYPSLAEGFGLPALEALACGAPLVTTAGTAMEEVADGAALLVPPGDADGLAQALEAVLAGGPDVEDRRRQGLEIAGRFTWEASAAAHVEVYRSVC